MLEKAIEFARTALMGQFDEHGRPYIDHSIRVMELMKTEEEKVVAILHDVMEDSDTHWKSLKDLGLSYEIMDCLDMLTRRNDVTYFDYIEDLSTNPITAKVKLAEINDNMDQRRVEKMSFQTYQKNERCEKAKEILKKGLLD